MAYVLVVGAGLAGCTSAQKMASMGKDVILVERENDIGGRVRRFGCKATDKCNNCGVCLTGNLWQEVAQNPKISILLSSEVIDFSGEKGDFSVTIKDKNGKRYFSDIEAVILSTGFDNTSNSTAHLQVEKTDCIISGLELEEKLLKRTSNKFLSSAPKSVAFIQCLGSRDKKEGLDYCSRVCCSYSTRAARVLRHYYPDCEIVLMYMDLQSVDSKNCFSELSEQNIEFIKCRPLKIVGGKPASIHYDIPGEGAKNRAFDLVVLSEGISPRDDSQTVAATYGLAQDKYGFLHAASGDEGIYVAGCAKKPMKIEETYADSLSIASKIVADIEANKG